jgi:hypothetical protein
VIDALVTAENRHKYRPVRHASSVGWLDNESYKEPQILTTECNYHIVKQMDQIFSKPMALDDVWDPAAKRSWMELISCFSMEWNVKCVENKIGLGLNYKENNFVLLLKVLFEPFVLNCSSISSE